MIELAMMGRRRRARAIRELAPSEALAFALRRVLFTDRDAAVRAAAARRIGGIGAGDAWLIEALADRSPLVRDAVLRALAAAGTAAAIAPVREVIAGDELWWVRRSAVYALGAIAGAGELAVLRGALADPFWRVRHAAIKVLAVLGARDPSVRDELAEEERRDPGAIAFLRSSWGPVALEAPARAVSVSRLPEALLDPDPAVVTARLARGVYEPRALVELLCDPHVPLRELAARRIAESRDGGALEAALEWLEEPRIPQVAETVRSLLDGMGDPAAALAARVLGATQENRRIGEGGARWAIEWVVATRSESLYEAARARAAGGGVGVKRAAMRIASEAELIAWIEPRLVDEIAGELHARGSTAALLAIDTAGSPRARALQIDARGRCGDRAGVETGLRDPHPGPRAIAAQWWARCGEDMAALAEDPDPAVREAALTPATAVAALGDVDPWVRRAAIRMIAATWGPGSFGPWHGNPGLHPPTCLQTGGKRAELPEDVAAAARAALEDRDPELRMYACLLPLDERGIAIVFERLADPAISVRAAAHDAIARLPDAAARIGAIVDGVGRRATSTVESTSTSPSTSTSTVESTSTSTSTETESETESESAGARSRRAFGRAGFEVAPLAISGAYDVSPRALHAAAHAGVDLYFWEPGYDVLGGFLRGKAERRVITGTYHADARSIRTDVERALRQLRRETLDAFLLFWTRSQARLDGEALEILDELRRAGKLRAAGFSTHHRALAREAIEAAPWDVVMIRHSAAHPGIETELLPVARERGTAIVTFSALTYGRMISGPGAPSAADCYRYSLSQPGVTACISAPRRDRELAENLAVVERPLLDAAQIAALRAHGARVHAESQRFNTLVRQPTRDAAAAARELLAAELPPPDAEAIARPLPHAAPARRSRSRLR